MMIMKNHADLLREIEIIKEQIEQLETSVKYWNGDGLGDFILAGEGASVHGLSIAAQNVDRINRKINALQSMLDAFEDTYAENEKRINQLTGLPYKIAKLRYVDGKDYREIAVELGYSYDHIRRVASQNKGNATIVPHTGLTKGDMLEA